MKIAWIDNRYDQESNWGYISSLCSFLKKYDLSNKINIEKDQERFEKKFGCLNNYQNLILHAGIRDKGETLNRIKTQTPELKIYLLSSKPEDYKLNEMGECPIYEVEYIDGIPPKESKLVILLKNLAEEN